MIKIYVLGFAFNSDNSQVLLIRKNRPEWQAGFLNGIGGKIESTDSTPEFAMVREFYEETGMKTIEKDWNLFSILEGIDSSQNKEKLYIFESNVDIENAKTVETEEIVKLNISDIEKEKTIHNIPWLVNMALVSKKRKGIIYKIIEQNKIQLH